MNPDPSTTWPWRLYERKLVLAQLAEGCKEIAHESLQALRELIRFTVQNLFGNATNLFD
ncbi:MAG: hypothetical protein JST44_08290 [Cyanobacteria bacterium SZAS LIN-5]|nr:hypothetical protein [Cyanobacteria bacterium SZAS LIN-5]